MGEENFQYLCINELLWKQYTITAGLGRLVMTLEVTLRSSGTPPPQITPRAYFDSPRRALSGDIFGIRKNKN